MPQPQPQHFVTHEQLTELLGPIERQLMSTQADVDALTATLLKLATDLATATTTLQAEIDALAQANPTLNLDALQAAAAPLDTLAQALAALKPLTPVVVPPAGP